MPQKTELVISSTICMRVMGPSLAWVKWLAAQVQPEFLILVRNLLLMLLLSGRLEVEEGDLSGEWGPF